MYPNISRARQNVQRSRGRPIWQEWPVIAGRAIAIVGNVHAESIANLAIVGVGIEQQISRRRRECNIHVAPATRDRKPGMHAATGCRATGYLI